MQAELKYLHSPDIKNLESFKPKEIDNFSFLLQMIVGEKGNKGDESFDVIICTPKRLISNHKKNKVIFGLHYLIVFEYNYQTIYDRIKLFIDSVTGSTWDEIGVKIGMIGKWEFQDYTI